MDFRRVGSLPPYAFAEVNRRKADVIASGREVIDLGFGNPDLPSPGVAVDTLIAAATDPRNHRYSVSRGIDPLRQALARRYQRRFGVSLDAETEVIATIGAKEGLSHLLWVLVQGGDVAIVPEPSYPIHLYAPIIAGAEVRRAPVSSEEDYFEVVNRMFLNSWPRPRVILVSFPHNPTTKMVDISFFTRLIEFARENQVVVVHDFAYADVWFGEEPPPSVLQVPGASEVAVELYSLTKGHSMAGWRMGFCVGNPAVMAAMAKLKSYLDYGTFQSIQLAAAAALDEGDGFVSETRETYRRRRDLLVGALSEQGWQLEPPLGTMFVWAEIPAAYSDMGSLAFSIELLDKAGVAVSPGIGFGHSGDRHVRFALVEPEPRLVEAAERIAGALGRL